MNKSQRWYNEYLPNSMVRRVRIASHTVDHFCDSAPNAAHAADANANVKTTNMMTAAVRRNAAAAVAAIASHRCLLRIGTLSANFRQRRRTRTDATDSKYDEVETKE